MKKISILLIFLTIICISCGKQKQTQARLKHQFIDIQFCDNGTAKKLNDDFDYEYQENQNSLQIINGDTYQMFDSNGKIIPEWKIINYLEIKSPLQLTNFQLVSNKQNIDALKITETYLVVFTPLELEFKDEYATKGNEYLTMIEDWSYFISHTKAEIKEMGVKTINTDKRYISFPANNRENIVVDTTTNQNGKSFSAILYKKGSLPIMIFTKWADNDSQMISDYLGIKLVPLKKEEIIQNSDMPLVGKYRFNDCCELLLEISTIGDQYTFVYTFKDETFKGKVTLKPDGSITLNNIPWFKDIGELNEDEDPTEIPTVFHTVGIDCVVEKNGNLTFQNIGTISNYFQIIDCEKNKITLKIEK